jgi:Tol biopolymer transport system component
VGSAAIVFLVGVVVVTSDSGNEDKGAGTPGPVQTDLPRTSGYSNIYVLDVRSRRVDRLTDNHDEEIAQGPAWSKRGEIVWSQAASDESFAHLYLLHPGRSGKRFVGTGLRHLFQPSWAPDSRRVAVNRLGKGIYTVDVKNGAARRLSRKAFDEAPAWSPDGRRILFEKQVSSSNRDVYVMDASGKGARPLAHSRLQETNPAWSPDGRQIAFAEQQRNGNWVVYSADADGSQRRRITSRQRSSQEPAWSPDGRRIAFVAQRGAAAWITITGLRRGKPIRLTGSSLVASGPAWSPDGRRIAFSAKAITNGREGNPAS